MRLACIVFTREGEQLAGDLLPQLEGWHTELALGYGTGKANVYTWAKQAFTGADALLFIGAAGIAVRAIAPLVKDKVSDPAVVVMDEAGQWAVPLLSGHIGGANLLAGLLAALCGGQAVLTTATDVRGLWAVDDWAARNGLAIKRPRLIKEVSARLLRGEEVRLYSDVPVYGMMPRGVARVEKMQGAHVVISPYVADVPDALWLVPRCIHVGIGCRKGADEAAISKLFEEALRRAGVCREAVACIHTIDLKAEEPGLNHFCAAHGFGLVVYSAEALQAVAGSISSSSFVQNVVGVDNVCERSALAGGGWLLLPKLAGNGVTAALAMDEQALRFE